MIDWRESYTTYWRLVSVDPDTWADKETINNVGSAKITRTADGELLEAGSVEVVADEFAPGYYRLVCTAVSTSGASERVEVCTLLLEGASRTYEYGSSLITANGKSVLYPASVRYLIGGEYAPANVNGALYAANILSECIDAPIEVETGFTLNNNVVFPFGSSVLDAAWMVLNAGNCVMQIDGGGVVHIRSMPTLPSIELSNVNARLLVPGIKAEYDLTDVPNQYVAVDEFSTATATNNNPDSPTSIPNRGYVQMFLDESPTPIDGETLERYAERRLMEESTVRDARTYSREYFPGVLPYDVVRGSISSVGLNGDMRVINQSLNCDGGILVSEKAASEVRLWQS